VGEPALTPERILEAAEEVLRRFGPEKATVVDVARALGVTHGSVYRHFASKAALRDAVVRRWLETMMPPLEAVAAEQGPAPRRLRRWLELLIAAKRRRATEDPELFATYSSLKKQAREVLQAHVDALVCQAARIIADGVARGEFTAADPTATGRAVLHAMTRFYGPAHAAEWSDPAFDEAFDQVWHLLVSGLGARQPSKAAGGRDAAKAGRVKRK
jgi:AcrR family transcriptional regulator